MFLIFPKTCESKKFRFNIIDIISSYILYKLYELSLQHTRSLDERWELNNKKHLQLDVELNDQIQMFNFF